MGRAARRLSAVGLAVLALCGAGTAALAQRTGAPARPVPSGPAEPGWSGLPPIEPEPPAEGGPASDAEAAGLRGSGLPTPVRPPTAAERERQRAEARRAPWTIRPARPAPVPPRPSLPEAEPPPQPSGRPAPVANPRTGRMPRPQADTAARRRPLTIRPSAGDERALQTGLRGVTPPVQPTRPVDVPIVVERQARPSGRVLPNANPLGRGAVIDPATGEVVSYARRPRTEADPFAPIGLRLGSFTATGSVEEALGYDSNPRRLNSGIRGSLFSQTTGEADIASDWSRHALAARVRGSYTAFFSEPGVNRPDLSAVVTGRADIARDTRLETEARYLLTAQSPGSSNLPSPGSALRGLPLVHQFGGSTGLVQDFGRWQVALRGTADRYIHDDAATVDGEVIPQGERNYNAFVGRLRVSYEANPGIRPFAEASVERRSFDTPVTAGGFIQGSTARTLRIGSTFELSRLLTGEVSAGYLLRDNADPARPAIRMPVFDAALAWTPTPLTTVRLTAKSAIDESFVVTASAIQRRDLAVELEHAFRRWLVGTARFAYGDDVYVGDPRRDRRFVGSLALIYRASRMLQIRGEVRREVLTSNQPGNSYAANVVLLGLKLQR